MRDICRPLQLATAYAYEVTIITSPFRLHAELNEVIVRQHVGHLIGKGAISSRMR